MERVTIHFSKIRLYHNEIGTHRGRTAGLKTIFQLAPLRDLPFLKLAQLVKHAYTGKCIPDHNGWSAQHEALRWFVDQGRAGIYAIDPAPLHIARRHSHVYLLDGHHRALALYILGEERANARLEFD
jgi:hypothetical protein